MIVAAQDVVLIDREPQRTEATQPLDQGVETADLAGHLVITGHVPDHIIGNERSNSDEVHRSECIDRSSVRRCVGVLLSHQV